MTRRPGVARPTVTAAMVARSGVVAEPRWSPDGRRLGWAERRHGTTELVVAPSAGGSGPVTISGDVTLGGVRPDGGGSWCWAGDDAVVVASGHRLVLVPASGGRVRDLVVGPAGARLHSPTVSVRSEVAYVAETDSACDVAVVGLDGSDWPRRRSTAAWARDPEWSPDGDALAWHEWDAAAMPWDSSRIVLARADARPGEVRLVAGGDRHPFGVAQPRFSPDGRHLGWVDDRDGWMRLRVAAADGSRARLVLDEPHEHAEASWGPGTRSWAWSPSGDAVALCRNEHGFGRLVVVPVRGRRVARDVARGWHHGIDWGPEGIVAVRSGARTPSQVTVSDPAARGGRRSVARGPVGGFEAAGLVEPEPVRWRAGATTVPGVLHRPPGVRRPPLLVDVHGGPTDQAVVEWRARVAFWVDRGWAVLRPDPRGSTGHGRAHRRALDGGWGRADVVDVAAGIRHAGRAGWADPERVVVTGASAGGFTALLVATRHPNLVRAVVATSAVTDLVDLAARTHRFESRYLDRLVGELPRAAAAYRARSPLTGAARLRVPVLLIHGDDDPVVPVDQARSLAEAVRASGGQVELHVYPGEGHGISGEAHVVDELERTEAFLARHVLGLARVPGG